MSLSLATDRAFLATLMHTPVRGQLEVIPEALVVTAPDGAIKAIHRRESPLAEREAQRFAAANNLVTFGADQYLLPGLVDMHIHARSEERRVGKEC